MVEAVSTESVALPERLSVEEAYRRHHGQLWRALLAYSGSQDIASDAAAEAFAQALRRGDAVKRPDRWVWKAAFRIAAGLLKDRSRFATEIELQATEHQPEMELRWALMQLSPRQRASLFLFYYAGYPPGEIAEMIGSTQSAVRVHLYRGRKRLERLLTEVGHD